MLKSDFGKVEIKGITPLLMAELSTIIFALRQNILTDEQIKEAIEDGFKSQEQMDATKEKLMNKERSVKEVQDLIRKITNARKSGLVENEEDDDIQIHYIDVEDLNKDTKDSLRDILGKITGE